MGTIFVIVLEGIANLQPILLLRAAGFTSNNRKTPYFTSLRGILFLSPQMSDLPKKKKKVGSLIRQIIT